MGINDEMKGKIGEVRNIAPWTSLDLSGDEKHVDKLLEKKWNINEILIGNEIGDKGIKMISEVLKTNSTLTELNLSSDKRKKKDKYEKK